MFPASRIPGPASHCFPYPVSQVYHFPNFTLIPDPGSRIPDPGIPVYNSDPGSGIRDAGFGRDPGLGAMYNSDPGSGIRDAGSQDPGIPDWGLCRIPIPDPVSGIRDAGSANRDPRIQGSRDSNAGNESFWDGHVKFQANLVRRTGARSGAPKANIDIRYRTEAPGIPDPVRTFGSKRKMLILNHFAPARTCQNHRGG